MQGPDPLLAVVRAVHFAAVIALFGQLAFVFLVSPRRERPPRFLAVIWWSTAFAVASALAWLALEASNMGGMPVVEAVTGETLRIVATQTLFGHVWYVRIVVLVLLVPAIAATPRLAWLLAAVLVASLAAMGHAAGSPGAEKLVRLGADGLHLLAAATWLGALLPLELALRERARRADRAAFDEAAAITRRFSFMGMAAVGTIVLTGVVNTVYTVHAVSALYQTAYGELLLAKLALFAVAIALAAVNRYVLTPRLAAGSPDDTRAALTALRRNTRIELAGGIAILGIVGFLGISMPPSAPMAHPV